MLAIILSQLKSIFKLASDLQETLRQLADQQKELIRLLHLHDITVKPRAVKVVFHTIINGQTEEIHHMFLKVSQHLPLSVTFQDAQGNPATVEGAPTWAMIDNTLATIDVAPDGMSALVKPAGVVGVTKVQVKADADLGEGIKEIVGELDLELISGEAVMVAIIAGTPIDPGT